MRRERTFKKTLLFLAIMSVMIFAMSITASAAATNIKQTDSSKTSVSISWDGTNISDGYKVYWSKTENGTYSEVSSYVSTSKTKYISGFNAGTTYYIKVASYANGKNYYAMSAPVQVVTTPESVDYSTIKQTAGTSRSVTVAWGKSAGATGYLVSKDNGASTAIAKNSITISAKPGQKYSLNITAFKKAPKTGYVATAYKTTRSSFRSAPSTPMYYADGARGYLDWKPTNKTKSYPTMSWKANPNDYLSPDGYQIEVYTVDGKKKISTATVKTRSVSITSAKNNALIRNRGFRTRIRAYIKVDNAVCYSNWSAIRVIVPQAATKITATSHSSVRVTWPKVANATKYIIYVSRDVKSNGSGHWTNATLSASTTSFNIKGLTKFKDFGVYVIPVVKIGGKYYKAAQTWYVQSWVY